jgi:hypothetical protein
MAEINLKRFTQEKEVTAPVLNGVCRTLGRLIETNEEDGWYRLKLGNRWQILRKATPLEILKAQEGQKTFVGYPMGEDVVPFNFDMFFRRGFGETIHVSFMNENPWDIVRFIQWDDSHYYSCGSDPKASRTVINQVKEAYENEKPLEGIRGVTPEIRYVFLLHSLQRDAFRAAKELETLKLAEEERQKRIQEFRATFAGNLQKTIEDAGGQLIRFSKKGSNYVVIWKINGQQITSTIKDNQQILELGFCASGYDKEHSLSSAIKLAQTYYEEGGVGHGGLYITRS